jgi:hypothetical protein
VNDHLENKLISGALHVLKFGVHDMIERGESVISCDPGTLFIHRTMSCGKFVVLRGSGNLCDRVIFGVVCDIVWLCDL